MHKMSCRLSAVLGVFFTLFVIIRALPCQADDALHPDMIEFGIFPYKSPKTIIEMYGPLAAHLEKKLGKKIKIVSALDARSFVEKARTGQYDFLLLPPIPYYKLQPLGYKVIAKGLPGFYGGAIVREDSDIRTVEQLKGKKVAAIGDFGYAGYSFILPQLEAKGVNPHKEVDFQFLGKVDSIVYGVINKKYDAGLLRLDSLDLPAFAGIREQLVVIARSPEIPQFPFVVKNSMDPATASAIQNVLAALSPASPEDAAIMNSMQVEKVVAAEDADYADFYLQIKDTETFRQP